MTTSEANRVATPMANDMANGDLRIARTNERTNERINHLPETSSVGNRASEAVDNSKVVAVTLRLPVSMWWRLAGIADKTGAKVADVIGAMIADGVTKNSPKHRIATIERMVLAGHCDADIAAELGMTNYAVSSQRRRLGLKANRNSRPGSWGAK